VTAVVDRREEVLLPPGTVVRVSEVEQLKDEFIVRLSDALLSCGGDAVVRGKEERTVEGLTVSTGASVVGRAAYEAAKRLWGDARGARKMALLAREAAEWFHPEGAALYGLCLARGLGVERNRDEANRAFRQSMEGGCPRGMAGIAHLRCQAVIEEYWGEMYPDCCDAPGAGAFMLKAAQSGSPWGMAWLAEWHLGYPYGTDEAEGVAWARKAWENGWGSGARILAGYYSGGRFGVPRDEDAVHSWLLKAEACGFVI
jgi:TPR repeat protein